MAYPDDELYAFKRWRVERVLGLAAEGEPDLIHGTLILAMGSRESNLRNIVGDYGHGRGFVQIDDRYHPRWLASVPGCISGEWAEVYGTEQGGALPSGRCPGLTHSVKKCISTLRFNITYSRKSGIPEHDLIRVAVAGWNCGVGTAIRAYKTKADPDYYTTGKDYSRDVLSRQQQIRAFIQRLGWGS